MWWNTVDLENQEKELKHKLSNYSDSDDISFTCDFISRENGSPLFLEAGPKIPVDSNNVPVYEWGSHPCYFIDKKVTGIALSKNNIMSLDKVLYD